jgi:subtilisin-like proprotein convertase family protein
MSFKHIYRTSGFLALTLILSSCNSSGGGSSDQSSGNIATDTHETAVPGMDDPLASYAWHLENTGQSTFTTSSGTAGQDMDIKEVMDDGVKGAGIKIAVSDTGVDVTHSDLEDNQIVGQHRDYSGESSSSWRNGNPFPIEAEGHGTAVTGLISALGQNGIGSRGVAPGSHFAGFLFVGDFHTTMSSYEAKTIDQMTGDFDIFNYSYGYSGCEFIPMSATILSAYKNGVTNLRNGKGAIYIQAAGNDYYGYNSNCYSGDNSLFFGNTNSSEDHNHPYVILAAATNAKGKVSSYSTPGSGVWISSAGGESGSSKPAMLTTDIQSCTSGLSLSSSFASTFNKGTSALNPYCNYTSIMNGTSSAAPVLSGIVALMLEVNPDLTWRDVKHILAVTADTINYSTAAINHPEGSGSNLTGHSYDYLYVRNGAGIDFSNTYGFGRVNADRAVTMARTYTSPLGTYRETDWSTSSGTINLSVPDASNTGVTNTLNMTTNYIIESVQIKVTFDHTLIGDLGVELLSPAGTRSKLLLIRSNIKDTYIADFPLLSNAFYGEASQGNWTIKVVDGLATHTGKLVSWKLKINGHTP